MIGFGRSMSLAMSVFYRVASLMPESEKTYLIQTEAYQNGREQGLCIGNLHRVPCSTMDGTPSRAYIAEHRNSNNIVVYIGGISLQSISDEIYKTARFFKTVDEAALYIVDRLGLHYIV